MGPGACIDLQLTPLLTPAVNPEHHQIWPNPPLPQKNDKNRCYSRVSIGFLNIIPSLHFAPDRATVITGAVQAMTPRVDGTLRMGP